MLILHYLNLKRSRKKVKKMKVKKIKMNMKQS